jgi:uncharacterized damage-inducible protein DinB
MEGTATQADTAAVEALVETWRIGARVVLYVLDAVAPEALTADSGLRGRTVGEQFAHLHNVRLMWLESAAPALLAGLVKVERADAGDPALLRRSLAASAEAVEAMLRAALAEGRVKGFRPHPTAFLGYLLAHEAYHQGDIGVRLQESGHPLDKKVSYGMWEWGTR